LNKKKVKRIIGIVLLVLVLIMVAAFVAFRIYTSSYYAADTETIEKIKAGVGDSVASYTDESGVVFLPESGAPKAVVVFYPGGKVEYSAYSGLMYELANMGYVCVIPRMKWNLAFFSIGAIDDIRQKYADEMHLVENLDWYLAGHSLGGVAAAEYLAGKADNDLGDLVAGFKGLILCASYPADSLAETNLRLLSILGSNDGVINIENYEESRTNWPQDSTEYVIDGGIHSYFGSYGIQEGDGEPAITNYEQLDTTAEVIDKWISG
jgi:hypothetical protein